MWPKENLNNLENKIYDLLRFTFFNSKPEILETQCESNFIPMV